MFNIQGKISAYPVDFIDIQITYAAEHKNDFYLGTSLAVFNTKIESNGCIISSRAFEIDVGTAADSKKCAA